MFLPKCFIRCLLACIEIKCNETKMFKSSEEIIRAHERLALARFMGLSDINIVSLYPK